MAIYCFCSGYGLFIGYQNNKQGYSKKNAIRILRLYINYWIILFIFVLGVGFAVGKSSMYPGDFKTFFLTFTAIDPAYNGAWWFVTTYIILVTVSPVIFYVIKKWNVIFILGLSLVLYVIAYVQRIHPMIESNGEILSWIIRQAALFGTSFLPFIVGALFAHGKIYSKLSRFTQKIKWKNTLAISGIVGMIILHGFIETLFIAPFTGILFICLFNLIDKPIWMERALNYFGNHSTNVWLIHMFFYMVFFEKLVFYPHYPLFIYVWLIVLSLGASYLVNFIYRPIVRGIDYLVVRRMDGKHGVAR